MTNSSDEYLIKPGSKEDPFADLRKTLRARLFIAMKHGEDTREFFEEVAAKNLSMEGDEERFRS